MGAGQDWITNQDVVANRPTIRQFRISTSPEIFISPPTSAGGEMPPPAPSSLFKLCIFPCCFDGCVCSPFDNCCAIRCESNCECDPTEVKNCYRDCLVQQCCYNILVVFPSNAEKMGGPPSCGCCNQNLVPCTLACPLLCFSTCSPPASFPDHALCCTSSCICCVQGCNCQYPQCCAMRVRDRANCAPFMRGEAPSLELQHQWLCQVVRCAYPLSPAIASTIGCCGVVCWTNANHTYKKGGDAETVAEEEGEGEEYEEVEEEYDEEEEELQEVPQAGRAPPPVKTKASTVGILRTPGSSRSASPVAAHEPDQPLDFIHCINPFEQCVGDGRPSEPAPRFSTKGVTFALTPLADEETSKVGLSPSRINRAPSLVSRHSPILCDLCYVG